MNRLIDEEFQIIHKARASVFHRLQGGVALNEARGYRQISRVYVTAK